MTNYSEVIELASLGPFQGKKQVLRVTAQRLTRGKLKGEFRLNLRVWYFGDDGELRPTGRGWQFGQPSELAALLPLLTDALREAHSREMITAATLLRYGVDPSLLLLESQES